MFKKTLFLSLLITQITHSSQRPSFSTRVLHKIGLTEQVTKPVKDYMKVGYHAASRLYEPFRHPLYTNFIEPLYVGVKSKYWGRDLNDRVQGTYRNTQHFFQQSHVTFAKKFYVPWKRLLSDHEVESYSHDLSAYEKAYHDYMANPENVEKQHELLMHTENIQHLMQAHRIEQQKQIFDRPHTMLDARYR